VSFGAIPGTVNVGATEKARAMYVTARTTTALLVDGLNAQVVMVMRMPR
jgi:hypothetical protein